MQHTLSSTLKTGGMCIQGPFILHAEHKQPFTFTNQGAFQHPAHSSNGSTHFTLQNIHNTIARNESSTSSILSQTHYSKIARE